MSPRGSANLKLGSKVVELLVKQRRPMLMVDFVDAFFTDPVPTIEAGRHISMNEPFFDGHFPDLPMWPAALSIPAKLPMPVPAARASSSSTVRAAATSSTSSTVLASWPTGFRPATFPTGTRNLTRNTGASR